jgi:hypothetical protein
MGKRNYYDQALGSYEAACLLGMHWGQPSKLLAKGVLTAHVAPESAYSEDPTRFPAIYDGREIEKNYLEYEEKVAALGGQHDRRPRAWLHLRPEAIRRLKAIPEPIDFADAVTLVEAAKILSVHISLVPRMIAGGKIVGRVPWNPRGVKAAARNWIVSRKSCQANIKETRAREVAGTKPGTKRKKAT